MPGAPASIAEMHRRAVVRMANDDEERTADRASAVPEIDEAAGDVSVLAPLGRRKSDGLQPLGRGGTDQNSVVPGELCDRLGQFLQPAVVGESAVENRRVVSKDDLEPLTCARRRTAGSCQLTRLAQDA